MKKIILGLIILSFAFVVGAEDLLTTPKDIFPPQAYGIASGYSFIGNAITKQIKYDYYWTDSNGVQVPKYRGKIPFSCRNWDAYPSDRNEDCVADDDPVECCDGAGAGTCDDVFDNADCTADGAPLECCTSLGEGVCECWRDVKAIFVPVKDYLDGELDKWENITRQ